MAASHDIDDIEDKACGLFSWRPSWLQKFLSHQIFIFVFILLGVSQSMIFSYLTVVLSTIEKQFGVKSAEIAWVYSGNEISQICFILFLPFVGRAKKRPLLMGLASIISGFGMILIAMPYIAGRGQDVLQRAVNSAESVGESNSLCSADNEISDDCDNQATQKDWVSVGIIFVGIFTVGIGSTSIFSFGIPYVDDNSEKEKGPIALSFTMAARILGPAFGYVLGSFTLRVFANPGENPPGLNEDNPLWVGAWWMGFVIVGCIVLCVAPLMTLFPALIPPPKGSHTDAEDVRKRLEEEKGPSNAKEWWAEFFSIVKRLFTNKIYVFTLGSTVFTLLAIIGFAQFLPKYFEFVFRRRASTSGLVGPVANSGATIIGLIISGIVISKFKPRARILGAWSVVIMVLAVLTFAIISQIGCPPLKFYGESSEDTETITFNNLACNKDCKCSSVQYEPICSADGETHLFSPCLASCKEVEEFVVDVKKNKTIQKYSKCDCVLASSRETKNQIADPWPATWPDMNKLPPATVSSSSQQDIDFAYSGYCPSDCSNQFYLLLGLMLTIGLVAGSGRLPNTLILLRAVEKRDKAAAMTVTVSFVSAFALLPSPIIFGSVYDGACTIWAEKCGEKLNCLAYNTDKLRIGVGTIATIFVALGLCCDTAVWYFVKGLNIYDDDHECTEENDNDNHTTITTDYGTRQNSMELDHHGKFEKA